MSFKIRARNELREISIACHTMKAIINFWFKRAFLKFLQQINGLSEDIISYNNTVKSIFIK